jgi:predicted secreted hydrolase
VRRRAWLLACLCGGALAEVRRDRALTFPRDHGAHPETRVEWWYATGWLGTESAPLLSFQLTFFRSRTGLAEGLSSRFAARQLLFAHAAVTDLAAPAGARHRHAQRIARWTGDAPSTLAQASAGDTDLQLAGWTLRRDGGVYRAWLPADEFTIELELRPTQPLLLQGDAGFSRKGPDERQASHYYSQPQLAVRGSVGVGGRRIAASGRGWLDHEWSDSLLAPGAVGWDWIGIDLFDGSSLTLFRIRRVDGSAFWAGGSFRSAGLAPASFGATEVRLLPGRAWTSPATQTRYPVEWHLECPAGRFELRALDDAQELDSRASTGAIYWEGLAELRDARAQRVGLGYLEMTGYFAPLRVD